MTLFVRVRDAFSGHEYDVPEGALAAHQEPLNSPDWPDVEGAGRPPVFAERKPESPQPDGQGEPSAPSRRRR
jgi:hypothetical protein